MAKLISKVYGDALFSYALENNLIEKTYEEAIDIKTVFTVSKELNEFLMNPIISTEEKKQTINDLFLNKVWGGTIKNVLSFFKLDNLIKGKDTKILSFVNIIIDKGRSRDIVDIFDYFLSRVREYKNIGVAKVVSAYELDDKKKNEINKKLVDTTKYDDFIIDYVVDESLISGLKIIVGDKVLDSSLKSKIETLSKNLRGV